MNALGTYAHVSGPPPPSTIVVLKYCLSCGMLRFFSLLSSLRTCDACQLRGSLEIKDVRDEAVSLQVQAEFAEEANKVHVPRAARSETMERRLRCGRRRFVSWLKPLVEEFKAKERLTAADVGKIVGTSQGSVAVWRAKCLGLHIVVVGSLPGVRGSYRRKVYALEDIAQETKISDV